MPHVFHVGQKVKCIHERGAAGQFTPGNIYTVSYVDGGSLGILEDDEGRANGWNAIFFEPAADNRQSVVLYTVLWKVAGDDKIWSSGCPTEAFALAEKATLEEDVTVEYVCMKKITVRI